MSMSDHNVAFRYLLSYVSYYALAMFSFPSCHTGFFNMQCYQLQFVTRVFGQKVKAVIDSSQTFLFMKLQHPLCAKKVISYDC